MKHKIDTIQLKQFIAENKTAAVFTALKATDAFSTDARFQNTVTILEARWQRFQTGKTKGILSAEQQTLDANRINDDLMALLDAVNQTDTAASTNIPDATPAEKPGKLSWKSILTICAAIIGVLAGIAEISGYSIRDWWESAPATTKDTLPEKPIDTITSLPITPPPASEPLPVQPTIDDPQEAADAELPAPKAALQVQIKTQKGDQDLVFSESEEVRLYVKVNRACKLRTIYRLADGMLILLDNDRRVNAPETNKWVQLSDGFEVAAPFGVEELYIFAQERDFPALQTEAKDGYTFITEGLPTALTKTRGLKKKQVFAEDKLRMTTRQHD